jgi:hypothetical protein
VNKIEAEKGRCHLTSVTDTKEMDRMKKQVVETHQLCKKSTAQKREL